MAKETLEDRVEGLYDKKKLTKALFAGKVAGAAGSGIGAVVGERMFKGSLLGVMGGASVIGYALAWIVRPLYWRHLNKDYYKGWKGTKELYKDEVIFAVRRTPAVMVHNLVYYSSLALFYSTLGVGAAVSGVLASAASMLVYLGGSVAMGKGLYSKKKKGY